MSDSANRSRVFSIFTLSAEGKFCPQHFFSNLNVLCKGLKNKACFLTLLMSFFFLLMSFSFCFISTPWPRLFCGTGSQNLTTLTTCKVLASYPGPTILVQKHGVTNNFWFRRSVAVSRNATSFVQNKTNDVVFRVT